MSVVVVGSVAYDGIKSPSGQVDRCLGGAATYFALSASYFTNVRVVAVVGEDFSKQDEDVLRAHKIDTRGIEHSKGKSFFWRGEYGTNLNEAKTLETQLNVFQDFNPQVPVTYLDSEYLFLANIDPVLQSNVRRQMDGRVKLVGGDTMNYWITDPGHRENLLQTLKGVDVLLINDNEAKLIAQETSARGKQNPPHGAAGARHKARRIRRHGFLQGRRVRRRKTSFPRSCITHGRGARSNGRRRFICRRLHGIHCVAKESGP
jgi:hypothetical protein